MRTWPVALLVLSAMLTGVPALTLANPCGSWQIVLSPSPGNAENGLSGVAVRSPGDVWSVGRAKDGSSSAVPMAIHWDGAAWSLVSLPDTTGLGTSPVLMDVDVAGADQTWAVGYVTTGYPANNLPLVLRRTGGTWDYVNTVTLRPQTEYPYSARGGFAYSVEALAADDVWAVGTAVGFGDAQATSVGMAVHWDGSAWTDIDVPRVANRSHSLQDAAAISSNDVWAVGYYRNVGDTYRAVVYRWNGAAWIRVVTPAESIAQSFLHAIVALGPNDIWAAGSINYSEPLFLHWDGSSWTIVAGPAGATGEIHALAAIGPADIWATAAFDSNFYHWDGIGWTSAGNPPVPGATSVNRAGGLAVVGSCDVWSVGSFSTGSASFTLVERLAADALPGDLNCDGTVDFADINPFVLALTDPAAYAAAFPNCAIASGDINGDGSVDFGDINPFVALLTS
jgi:hypothetical protein